MSVNGRGATAPELNNSDQSALREFWDVYESHFREIGAQLADDDASPRGRARARDSISPCP
jgi:hypothetical protein